MHPRARRRGPAASRMLAGSIVAVTLVIGAASGLTVMQMRRSAWEQVGRVSQNLLEAVEHMVDRNIEFYDLSIRAVVDGLQNPAIDAGNVDHRLYWFGDIPGSFEHVQKSKHLRRSGQCEMKVSALTVIGLRVVVAQRDLQTGVHLDGVFVILFGCLLDGDGQCS